MFKNAGNKTSFKEIFDLGNNIYSIKWDKQPIMVNQYDSEGNITGQTEDPVNVSWMQETYYRKPELSELKNMILEFINTETDNKILNGFQWTNSGFTTGTPITIQVYLSSENQFNYKAAYDLAFQTSGQSLPFTMKFGEVDNPQYYNFTTLEEFSNFYQSCILFINTTLQEGWVKKDSIDWTKYEI